MRHTSMRRNQSGFTIVELMIATSVLAVILLFASIMIVNIGNLYYKGVNQARIQDTARTVTEDVVQHLELTSGTFVSQPSPAGADGTIRAYCIGTTRYTFIVDRKLGNDTFANSGAGRATQHVLWRDTVPAGTCALLTSAAFTTVGDVPGSSADGVELMTPNSRLTYFQVTGSSPFSIQIGLAYGDDDLLNHSGLQSTCKGSTGQQFCATATQQQTVVRRLKQ